MLEGSLLLGSLQFCWVGVEVCQKDESSSPSYYYSRPPHHTRTAFSLVSCEITRLIFVS